MKKKKQTKLITEEFFDMVPIEFVAKQKLKFIMFFGDEKAHEFVSEMVYKHLDNHGFNEKDLEKIDRVFTEIEEQKSLSR